MKFVFLSFVACAFVGHAFAKDQTQAKLDAQVKTTASCKKVRGEIADSNDFLKQKFADSVTATAQKQKGWDEEEKKKQRKAERDYRAKRKEWEDKAKLAKKKGKPEPAPLEPFAPYVPKHAKFQTDREKYDLVCVSQDKAASVNGNPKNYVKCVAKMTANDSVGQLALAGMFEFCLYPEVRDNPSGFHGCYLNYLRRSDQLQDLSQSNNDTAIKNQNRNRERFNGLGNNDMAQYCRDGYVQSYTSHFLDCYEEYYNSGKPQMMPDPDDKTKKVRMNSDDIKLACFYGTTLKGQLSKKVDADDGSSLAKIEKDAPKKTTRKPPTSRDGGIGVTVQEGQVVQ